ncbi:MAG: D-alanyl-D-alanine carboxypeptidase [Oscillospiraceae bacterium]|nr:D-alanyl-D-alanine carboxypeptidase [Oscillospiraceae bacterium]
MVKTKKRLGFLNLIVIFGLLVIIFLSSAKAALLIHDYKNPPIPEPPPEPVYPPVEAALGNGRTDGGIELYSGYVLLYDLDNDEVLYSRYPSVCTQPASLTKMMTVYTALQYIDDVNAEITIKYEDLAGLYEANASMAGFQEGDTVPIKDLIYGTMLPSGADAANALARASCGSLDEFILKMNETAQSLGMKNSQFKNVTGLDSNGHYTTADDLLILMKTALKDDFFREVICTDEYITVPTSYYTNGIKLKSTLSAKFAMMKLERGPLLGGKTGYTERAGLCLASIASINEHKYLLITMGADGDGKSPQTNLLDALNLYSRCK